MAGNKISIIVPIYKVEPFLKKCVESILVQTHRNLEIILVDDGSPDNCGAICDSYAAKDARIRVIHKPNGGVSEARNIGLDAAHGEYIGFVDPDDWVAPDMFEYLLKGLIATDAQISICNMTKVKGEKYITKRLPEVIYDRDTALLELFSDRMGNYIWDKLYKASLWENVRFPVGREFEDVLTIYKTFEKALKLVQLPEAKYYYRLRPGSISDSRDYSNRLQTYHAFCDRYRDVAPRYPQYKEYLVSRIRRYYCHELSYMIIHDKENRDLNQTLLDLLAGFVRENKDDLYRACTFSRLERKKFDAFALGTVRGCRRCYHFHRLLMKRGTPPYNAV